MVVPYLSTKGLLGIPGRSGGYSMDDDPAYTSRILFNDQFNADQHVYGSDSFNRADSAVSLGALDGGEKSGTAWTMAPAGTVYGISSNKAYIVTDGDAGGGKALAIADFSAADVEVNVSMTWVTGGNHGLTIRHNGVIVSANFNGYVVRLSGSALDLFRYDAGAATSLGTYAITPSNGSTYALKVVSLESAIKVFLDGIQRISVTDSTYPAQTFHGLRSNGAQAIRWEDFSVKSIVPNPARWTKVDTLSAIGQSNGKLTVDLTGIGSVWTDPYLVAGPFKRRAGLALVVDALITAPGGNNFWSFGFWDRATPATQPSANSELAVGDLEGSGATSPLRAMQGMSFPTVGSYASGTRYRYLLVIGHYDVANRVISANGGSVYIQGGAFGSLGGSAWTLLYRFTTGSDTDLYAILQFVQRITVSGDFARVYQHPFPMPRVYDSMVRADGAIGSAESGHAYTNVQGTAAIVSNEGWFSSDANADAFIVNAGVGDYLLQFDAKGDPGGASYRMPHLRLRTDSDSDPHLAVSWADASSIFLYKNVAGAITILGTGSFASSDNVYATISVLAIGSVIRVFADGVLKITHTLTGGDETTYANSKTYVGSGLTKGGSPTVAARFKNLFVQPGLGV